MRLRCLARLYAEAYRLTCRTYALGPSQRHDRIHERAMRRMGRRHEALIAASHQ